MLDDFNFPLTLTEQELLAEKAAQYYMSVNEFIIHILRRALDERNTNKGLRFSKEWYSTN